MNTIDLGQLATLIATTGAVGLVLNPVISFLKEFFKLNEEQNRTKKVVLSFITSVGGGILVASYLGQFIYDSLVNLLASIALVFTAATLIYNTYWKDSNPEKAVEKVAKNIT